MKKFLEFQLQNQVVVPNNQHNVFNFSKIKPLLVEIKSRYYNGDFGNVAMIRQERDRITWMDGLEIQLE